MYYVLLLFKTSFEPLFWPSIWHLLVSLHYQRCSSTTMVHYCMFTSVLNSSNSDLNRQINEISADTRKLGYFWKHYVNIFCPVSRLDGISWSYQFCSYEKNWFRPQKWSDTFQLVSLLEIMPPHKFDMGLLRLYLMLIR